MADWPPHLIHLSTLLSPSHLKENIRSLPPSLKRIKLNEREISLELGFLLPTELKMFHGRILPSDRAKFSELARNRGFTWVCNHKALESDFPNADFGPLLDGLYLASQT